MYVSLVYEGLAIILLALKFLQPLILVARIYGTPVAYQAQSPCSYYPGMPWICPMMLTLLPVYQHHDNGSNSKHNKMNQEFALLACSRYYLTRHLESLFWANIRTPSHKRK